MLKKVLISILFIVVAYIAFSQESSTMGKPRIDNPQADIIEPNDADINIKPIYNKVLIVPFEPKLYISEADRDIARKTGMVPAQIRDNFRFGLNNMLWAEINPTVPAMSMLANEEEVQKDLYYLYQSIGYHYMILPQEKEEVGKTKTEETVDKVKEKFSSTFKPAEAREKEQEGARIKNGQVYAIPQAQERYMHTRIINENAIEVLAEKYQAGYFLFINQFDIKIAPGVDQRQIENDMYPREIKVHYTIYDQFGQEVYGGAAKGYFPSTVNDMNRIVKGHLPKVAKEIANHVPNPELTKAMEQKQEEDNAKAEKQRSLISGEADF